jgi:hypothetical protein
MKLTEPKEKGRRFAPPRFKLVMGVFGGGFASYIPFVAQPEWLMRPCRAFAPGNCSG